MFICVYIQYIYICLYILARKQWIALGRRFLVSDTSAPTTHQLPPCHSSHSTRTAPTTSSPRQLPPPLAKWPRQFVAITPLRTAVLTVLSPQSLHSTHIHPRTPNPEPLSFSSSSTCSHPDVLQTSPISAPFSPFRSIHNGLINFKLLLG